MSNNITRLRKIADTYGEWYLFHEAIDRWVENNDLGFVQAVFQVLSDIEEEDRILRKRSNYHVDELLYKLLYVLEHGVLPMRSEDISCDF